MSNDILIVGLLAVILAEINYHKGHRGLGLTWSILAIMWMGAFVAGTVIELVS